MPRPPDPTYITADIEKNPVWKLAHWMSEVDNDNAPIGWGRYINLARFVLDKYKLIEK